jgi:uncharacterized membrane protein YgcG
MLSLMPPPNSVPAPMSPEDARRLARQRVGARKQRTRSIRRRVAAITLSLFVAVWVAIFVYLVTGHDPALGAGSRTAKAASPVATSQKATTSTSPPATTPSASAAAAAATATAESAAANGATGTTTSGSGTTGSTGSDTSGSSASGSGSSGSGSSGSSSGSSSAAAPVTTSQS